MQIIYRQRERTVNYQDEYYRLRSYDSLAKLAYSVLAWIIIAPYYRIFTTIEWLWYGQSVIGSTMVLVLVFLPVVIVALIFEYLGRRRLSRAILDVDVPHHQLSWHSQQYPVGLKDWAVSPVRLSWWNWESLFVRSKKFVVVQWPGLAEPIHLMESTWRKIHSPKS